MSALTLGLIAAICWGFHDVCVRFLSQKTPISACIITVLVTGFFFQFGLTLATGHAVPLASTSTTYSAVSGFFFVIASFSLYYAFQRGPVKVVAPLIASYPVFSVGWAVFNGTSVNILQWAAVLGIILGVSLVAGLSKDETDDVPPLGPTVVLSLVAAAGFAITFATGQSAAKLLHEIPATLITRGVAVCLTIGVILAMRERFWPGWKALPWLLTMGLADGIALYSVISAGGLRNEHFAAVSSSMFGLLTIVFAWIFLKEKMTAAQWGGCLIAFAGVGYLAI